VNAHWIGHVAKAGLLGNRYKGETMKKLIVMAAVVGLLAVTGCKSKNSQGGSNMDQNYGNTPADTGSSSSTNSVSPSTPSSSSSDLNNNSGATGGTGITPGGNSSGAGSSTTPDNSQNVPNTGSNTNLNSNGQPPQQ
jgi:hypothetical protein